MATTSKNSYEAIRAEILQGQLKPVYLLMGEEGYFIDRLTDLLEEKVLTETEKDFNLLTFYGADSDVHTIISAARRYPMMAERQLIVLKEAQNLPRFEELDHYFKNPMPSTVLVINYRHGTVDKRKAVAKNADKIGVLFESKKLYDNQIPPFIVTWFREQAITIEEKAAQMLNDYVGNEISKLIPQLEKLVVSLPGGTRRVTAELVEQNVGISKDYNNFELQKAIIRKDLLTANRIVDYFGRNPRENPMMGTVAILFNYFSNLLECYWLPRRDEQSVMAALQVRSSYFVRDYMTGLKNFSATKVMEIISELRRFDASSKGVDNVSASQHELLRELVYRIMH
ncbi:MAG: DNA polymerase III subunit delta [bacterium]|jgi:DNA polymerase-3 subunit delta|nr:DNA polymerase III subunit delta [bacterium]MDD3624053.1 DNA polymerase III subunit delta [Proteiniphilum sp.]MDD3967273.1 DNA polymerase III subunit delta [Proteiniphilum sp.]MDD4458535.1 DNA polymerase III subunit delta [Proteiniphilum sp.]